MTLCIFGAGGHAMAVWDAARAYYDNIIFFTQAADGPRSLCGCAVCRNEEGLRYDEVLAAVEDNRARLRLSRELVGRGAKLATVIHPAAYVSPLAVVGPGSCILAQAAVGAGARTGVACVVGTGAALEQECDLGAGVFVSAHAVVTAKSRVGDCALIGIGAAVVRDIPGNCMAAGIPAAVRKRL